MVKTGNLLIGARDQANYNFDTVAAIPNGASDLYVFATKTKDSIVYTKNVAKLGLSWFNLKGSGEVVLWGLPDPDFTVAATTSSGTISARSLTGGEKRTTPLGYTYTSDVKLKAYINASILIKSTLKNTSRNISGMKEISLSYSEFQDMIWGLAVTKFAKGNTITRVVDLPEPSKAEVGNYDINWSDLSAKLQMKVL
jgi:hypothetical protein